MFHELIMRKDAKTLSIFFLVLLIIISSLLFNSCEGPAGPEGEEGIAGIDGEDGEDGPEGPRGPVYWQGDYSSGRTYVQGDAVYFMGSSYICAVQTQGNLPTNSTYWDILALAGEMAVWTGGDVSGKANFLAGADFASGTTVDFTGATVSGLESWNGGIVTEATTFENNVTIAEGNNFEINSASRFYSDILIYDNAVRMYEDGNLRGDYSGTQFGTQGADGARVNFTTLHNGNNMLIRGTCRMRYDFDSGILYLYNSSAVNTIRLDGATGNIYYSGSLIEM